MKFYDKIKELNDLADIVSLIKKSGKKVVMCHGDFDLLHPGHLKHLIEAKELGDYLIVTLTPDGFINKGPGRPVYDQNTRLELLASLEITDYVSLNKWDTAVNTIKLIKPDFYVKGTDILNRSTLNGTSSELLIAHLEEEKRALDEVGGKLSLTEEVKFSTSDLSKQFFSTLRPELMGYINHIRDKHGAEKINSALNSLNDLKVLVVGDTIIDEYMFCDVMERAKKDPILVFRNVKNELYLGGILAIANHLSRFVKEVTLVSVLGDEYEIRSLIKSKLDNRINCSFFPDKDSITLIKRRYIEQNTNRRIFETYNKAEYQKYSNVDEDMLKFVRENIDKFDIVLVADFGHGCISDKMRELITEKSRFLALNVQTNSGNIGYHYFTKYKRADLLSLTREEARLALQDKKSDNHELIEKVKNAINSKRVNLTLDKDGLIYSDEENHSSPSLATKVVDTVGAGDSVLAITSLLSYKKVHPEIIAFVGNCVGSLAVRISGNERPISPIELKALINYILK
ncbi:MAG: PfkB family carbohydrate kinase [Nanoarchaeota archaeon]|nr:PfkB family carbohydrate kinase [Nanoarchaeota archaeon]